MRQILLRFEVAEVRPTRGWLRAVREAIGAKQDAVAKRIGVKRQSYARLEATEAQELAKRHDPTFKHLKAAEHSMALEDQAVGDLKPKP